jgi:hypothetical protein
MLFQVWVSHDFMAKKKQSIISLSMTEAEYIATCFANCEAIWLQKLLTDLFDLDMEATMILCEK